MKIGNDAIMLGAIAQPSLLPQHILDIGTGCGILALMMAQRFPIANITAIDIDRQTTQVAAANFESMDRPARQDYSEGRGIGI